MGFSIMVPIIATLLCFPGTWIVTALERRLYGGTEHFCLYGLTWLLGCIFLCIVSWCAWFLVG